MIMRLNEPFLKFRKYKRLEKILELPKSGLYFSVCKLVLFNFFVFGISSNE